MPQTLTPPQTTSAPADRDSQLSDARLAAVVEAAYILDAVRR
jgi:hypothetical protein